MSFRLSCYSRRQLRIRDILNTELNPSELDITDDSLNHAGHEGVRHLDHSETHFKVRAVSNRFVNMRMLDRHRLVNSLLSVEFESGLHALSMSLLSPLEVG